MKHTEVLSISTSTAQEWSSRYIYSGQRPYRRWWARYLGSQMKQGKFADKTPIHLAHLNGQSYVIDGQHRLAALAHYYQGAADFVIIHHYVEDSGSLAKLYSRQDQGLKRSFRDVVDAWGLAEITGISNKTQLGQIASAVKFIKQMMSPDRSDNVMKRIDLEELVAGVVDWQESAKVFFETVHNGELGSLILKSPVVAVALTTIDAEQDMARDFWYQVSYCDRLRRHDPRARLNRWLSDTRATGGAYSAGHKIYTAPQFARVCARCWNAFVDNEDLQKIYVPSSNEAGYPINLTDYRIYG